MGVRVQVSVSVGVLVGRLVDEGSGLLVIVGVSEAVGVSVGGFGVRVGYGVSVGYGDEPGSLWVSVANWIIVSVGRGVG